LSAFLVHAEELVLVVFGSTIIVPVAQIGWLNADVRIRALDLHPSAVDWQPRTGCRVLVRYGFIVTVVSSIANPSLVDAMSISTGEHSWSTLGCRSTVEFIGAVSTIINAVATFEPRDAASVHAEEVVGWTDSAVAVDRVFIGIIAWAVRF
jgi:hypothetical protein